MFWSTREDANIARAAQGPRLHCDQPSPQYKFRLLYRVGSQGVGTTQLSAIAKSATD